MTDHGRRRGIASDHIGVHPNHEPAVECALCNALRESARAAGPISEVNRMLMRTERFVVMPALGPLLRGHVLVVTRDHSEGLRSEPLEHHREYNRLIQRLRGRCSTRGETLLEIEHGGGSPGGRRPCISHTHVHLIPGIGHLVNAFDEWLDRIDPTELKPRAPYIWVSNGIDTLLYDAHSAVGQEIRRVLARALDIDDWDWLLHPKWDLVSATIKYWAEP